jgi:hypothetical protein
MTTDDSLARRPHRPSPETELPQPGHTTPAADATASERIWGEIAKIEVRDLPRKVPRKRPTSADEILLVSTLVDQGYSRGFDQGYSRGFYAGRVAALAAIDKFAIKKTSKWEALWPLTDGDSRAAYELYLDYIDEIRDAVADEVTP